MCSPPLAAKKKYPYQPRRYRRRTGEKGELLIPSALAYGPTGVPNAIPPNTGLRFEVELVDVQ